MSISHDEAEQDSVPLLDGRHSEEEQRHHQGSSGSGPTRGWLSEQLRRVGGGILRESPSDHTAAAGALLPRGYQKGKLPIRSASGRHSALPSSRAR